LKRIAIITFVLSVVAVLLLVAGLAGWDPVAVRLEKLGIKGSGSSKGERADSIAHAKSTPVDSTPAANVIDKSLWKSGAVVVGDGKSEYWTDVMTEPFAAGERIGQLLVGDTVKVVSTRAGWLEVDLGTAGDPRGWVKESAVVPTARAWKGHAALLRSCRVATAPGIRVDKGSMIPCGASLRFEPVGPKKVRLYLPNQKDVTVPRADVLLPGESLSPAKAIEHVMGFRRRGYQAGANTIGAMDAGGLVYITYRLLGVRTPRTVPALLAAGKPVKPEDAAPGDVLFFSTLDPARPHPVLLIDKGETYLEASPSQGVGVGLVSEMKNSEVVGIRRYP
jgi:hypothetical protein